MSADVSTKGNSQRRLVAIDCPLSLRGLSFAEGFADVTDWSNINASPSGDKLI